MSVNVKVKSVMRVIWLTVVAGVLLLTAAPALAASASGLIEDAIGVLREMAKQDDVSDMARLIKGAEAVAIVPSMMKAGFIISGEYGEGFVLRKRDGRWYGPSFYNLGGGSMGIQIGVQQVALVLVVNNEKGVESFLRSRSRLGTDVAVAAGPVGRRAEVATDARLRAEIYSYSMIRGLFVGASLEGSVMSISVQKNKEYWHREISAADALKQPATDERIKPLIRKLEELMKKAN